LIAVSFHVRTSFVAASAGRAVVMRQMTRRPARTTLPSTRRPWGMRQSFSVVVDRVVCNIGDPSLLLWIGDMERTQGSHALSGTRSQELLHVMRREGSGWVT